MHKALFAAESKDSNLCVRNEIFFLSQTIWLKKELASNTAWKDPRKMVRVWDWVGHDDDCHIET